MTAASLSGLPLSRLSLTARISLLFAIGAARVLLGLGWMVERSVENHFLEMDRHDMQGKLSLLQSLFAKAHGPEAEDRLAEQMEDALVGHHHLSVSVRAADGRTWFSYGTALPDDAHDSAEWRMTTINGHEFRILSARLHDADGTRHGVAIGLDISHHRQFMAAFHRTLALTVALAALLTAALGWIAVRTGLKPLRQVTQLAAGLSAPRLGERLPASAVPAEIDALAHAFNAMLDRLEAAFQRLSEFSSDIAHELRTPLSNLMTQTQVALSRARAAEDYRDILASNIEEYERLGRMVSDMLFLAQADNSQIAPRRETVDLGLEAARMAEFYEALADESGVRIAIAGHAQTNGDRLMLQRALSNLLSNAIRHTAAGGTVTLNLSQARDQARIVIENPGEIAAEHLPRLFDRFYTGDPARRASGEGAGLGLAITRSIVSAHGGRIQAESAEGQVRFSIVLPAENGE
jgi:two-component system heavy metal sensor histidine kinase CusS